MASKSGSCCADHQPSAPPGVSTEVQAPEPVQIEYDFVEEPPREYFCPVTFELLSEPQKTDCCGRQLAREVVSRLQREGKPCPLCNDPNISVTNDKHFKRKVNGLKVRCPHKRNGCEWVGELGDMGKHFTQCPLQLVECEFAQAGCHERVPRRDLARHMEEGGQRHLLSMSLLNLSLTRELHQKMAEKDRQIAELQEQLQEQSSKLEKQIKDLQGQCKRIEKQLQTVLESEFESDFQGEIQGEYCGTYTFESVQFPGVYLRMDGNGVTESVGPGGGTVNCQFGAGPWEEFELIYHADSCNYSIESVQFPGVYLRMDGNRVTRFVGPGGGVVNCQFGAGPWEKFNIDSSIKSAKFPGASLPSGTYTIESVQFPGVYLRMDGNGVTESVAPGGGTVNCQFGAGPWEEFKLNHIDSCNNSIESAGPLEKFNVDNSIKSAQFPGGACLPSGTYTFESVQFPGVYLRMDGNGVTESVGPGGGTVNCQFGAGSWEEFELIYHTDSCNYSIESVQFPGVYLRMDGNRVTRFVGPGGGVVNCQFRAGPWEMFKVNHVGSCNYSIESAQFPGVYLRMDGNGVTESVGPGGGTVNCQFGAGPWEMFKLHHINGRNRPHQDCAIS